MTDHREPFEPGLIPGLLIIIVVVLGFAIFADLSTCEPLEYGRDGRPTGPRVCGVTR